MDDEVSIFDIEWRSRGASQGVDPRDIKKSWDGDSCGSSESRSYPLADHDTAADIGIEGSAVFERKEFGKVVKGI